MNWDAVGALGEMIGASAVVISVVYLAFQVRANTRASVVDVVQNTIKAFSDLESIVASTPDLAGIILRGRIELSNLSPEEALRFDCYMSVNFQVLEGWYTGSAQRDAFPSEQVEVTETILRNHFRHRGVREWWKRTRDEYPTGFASWVDAKGANFSVPV